jgi:CHC2 zinc finger/Toprim domain
MPLLIRDDETKSQLDLKQAGAWRYSRDASTDVQCRAFAVDDGPIQLWTSDDPAPPEFIEAAENPDWLVVAFNDHFERLIEQHILAPRYGWPLVPIERHRCLQASALALALPAKLADVTAALNLEQRKDEAGHRLMLRMSRPRKPRAGEDRTKTYWIDDPESLAQLYDYCKQDVAAERALFHRIGFLSDEEQENWLLDARVNDRGIHLDRQLLDAAIQIAETLGHEIDAELKALTGGAVGSIGQTAKLRAWLAANDCVVTSLQKETVRKALTLKALSPAVRRGLELRREGAHSAAKKLKKMRAWMSEDDRVRGVYRFCGASTGRFTSVGLQMQNLKRPGVKDMAAAIEAVATGDLNHLRSRFAEPMSVLGDIGRALVSAPAGRKLIIADFSGIESRMTAWVSGQQSKVDQWANYDRTGNPEDEPYFITGHKIFGLPKEQAREPGKTGDLAFGYMGGIGAWLKLAPKGDNSTEFEIKQRQRRWRRAHKQTESFWSKINRAAIMAMRNPGRTVDLRNIKFKYTPADSFLRMKLPSGRKVAYPCPKLKTTRHGNDVDTAVAFMDIQKGGWGENRHGLGAYGGTWTENLVQAVARDLFIEAMRQLESAGYPIVLHAHDEAVAEVPEEFGSIEEFLAIFTALPPWASGLPVAAKGRISTRWCKIKPAASEPEPQDEPTPYGLVDADDGDNDGDAEPEAAVTVPVATPSIVTPERTSLVDLVGEEEINCPFHDDSTPSLHVYPDHFHCFGCGAHGSALDWLMIVEGLDRDAALQLLEHGPSNTTPRPALAIETQADRDAKRRRALQLWRQAQPIAGTLAERYLIERRGIDLATLPDAAASLRFHPHCPFGPASRHPCLLALRRSVIDDLPVSIHRIALTPDAEKIDRRMLGSGGVVKLWPASDRLVVGEGIETTLAAATRIMRWARLLQPAWSAVASSVLANLPPIPGVERLIILVDHDRNGAGQTAALRCAETWSRAGRSVVRLTPKQPGTDFNDLVKELAS